MSTSEDVRDILIEAAEALLGESLSTEQQADLINRFNRADGTFREKAQEALRGVTGLSESQIRIKTAASDNTDRIMTDLQNVLDNWDPSK